LPSSAHLSFHSIFAEAEPSNPRRACFFPCLCIWRWKSHAPSQGWIEFVLALRLKKVQKRRASGSLAVSKKKTSVSSFFSCSASLSACHDVAMIFSMESSPHRSPQKQQSSCSSTIAIDNTQQGRFAKFLDPHPSTNAFKKYRICYYTDYISLPWPT
jgi:hypothetical protein